MNFRIIFWVGTLLFIQVTLAAQADTIIIGFGQANSGIAVTGSGSQDPLTTIDQSGYLPNENAAARFLSQATLGYDMDDINYVTQTGIEDWVEEQFDKPIPYSLTDRVKLYHDFVRTETNNPFVRAGNRYWDYAWWHYHMTNDDLLRQRVALALSELFVISQESAFGNNPYALASFYDILHNQAFTNYRDILFNVSMHPAMGVYLTSMNNPKSDPANNIYPDENYAREIMQLFSIGTEMLNMDGSVIVDNNGVPVPTYDIEDIQELAKVFTGLSWGDRTIFNRNPPNDTSYTLPMIMFNDYHEPGQKEIVNGYIIPNKVPVDGMSDITEAITSIYTHPNLPPFISKFLIQRLVTANPPPEYVERVAQVFNDNGQGRRGDMKSVVRAILLDPYAKSCESGDDFDYGSLREPFIRYFQINKAFHASTSSGQYRNDMDYIYRYTGQRPLASPTVFNFFQTDYQPIGPIESNGKVGPVFQITDAQTLAGYINGLYRFIIQGNIADEYDLYSGEDNATYADEISTIDLSDQAMYASDEELHIMLDKLNLLLAHGRLTESSLNIIKDAVMEMPDEDAQDMEDRAKLAIYLLMTAPEYLINR